MALVNLAFFFMFCFCVCLLIFVCFLVCLILMYLPTKPHYGPNILHSVSLWPNLYLELIAFYLQIIVLSNERFWIIIWVRRSQIRFWNVWSIGGSLTNTSACALLQSIKNQEVTWNRISLASHLSSPLHGSDFSGDSFVVIWNVTSDFVAISRRHEVRHSHTRECDDCHT